MPPGRFAPGGAHVWAAAGMRAFLAWGASPHKTSQSQSLLLGLAADERSIT
jgi:hypothetical protein